MTFNRFIWGNYCQTLRGQEAIKGFSRGGDISDAELISQVRKYNPDTFFFLTPDALIDAIVFFESEYRNLLDTEVSNIDQACELYARLAEMETRDEKGKVIVPAGDYQFLLQANIAISYVLNFAFPDFFFPNLYCFNFGAFVKLCDNYEDFEMPEIPMKSDYRARYLYYADMCRVLYEFRINRGLSSAELAAFLYDFAPSTIEEEQEPTRGLPSPTAIWCIGGTASEPSGLWQCNEETRRGDIILYYQKAPKSAITHILLADSDGLIDPFFHFYSRAYLCNPVRIPDISRSILLSDAYFGNHPLVKKNFQGVNGWPMKYADYRRLRELLEADGFDTAQLPDLPCIDFKPEHPIRVEKDVEEYLLNPFLKECGVTERDYIRQMPLHMGRGGVKYPDYAVFARTEDGYESAQVLIEAKLEMKNNKEREDAFKQARSYALRLESRYIILCDRNAVWIYDRADRVKYERYSWKELLQPETFARMKTLFSELKLQH